MFSLLKIIKSYQLVKLVLNNKMASVVLASALGALVYSDTPITGSQGNLGFEGRAPSIASFDTGSWMKKAGELYESGKGVSFGSVDTSTSIGSTFNGILDTVKDTVSNVGSGASRLAEGVVNASNGTSTHNQQETAVTGDDKGNLTGNTFSKAKKVMYKSVYYDHQQTFYTGCLYSRHSIKPESCGLKVRKNKKRSHRTEVEHIFPAWEFAHDMPCWKKGGRKYCRENSPRYVRISSDLFNLVPAVGELNADRSNYPFGILYGERREYGQTIDFEVRGRVAEPTGSVRGDIARTYFYMIWAYNLVISQEQYNMFSEWAQDDPIDAWEIKRAKRISRLQGNINPFVQVR